MINSKNDRSDTRLTLHPIHTFHVDRMLQSWADSWEEYDEPTEEWKLVACPFLSEKAISLIFEFQNDIYDGNINRLYPARTSCFYKVYIYDPRTGKLRGRRRFRLQDAYCFTVFFYDGKLYGVVRTRSLDRYSVIQLWPGKCDNDQFHIGRGVTGVASDPDGNLYVGYACNVEREGQATMVCYEKHNARQRPIQGRFPATSCRDLTFDAKGKIWFHPYPDDCIYRLDGEKKTAFAVALPGFSGFGFFENGSGLLAAYDLPYSGGRRLFAMRRNHDLRKYTDPVPVEIDGIGAIIPGVSSFLGRYAAFYADGELFVVDLNELNRKEPRLPERKRHRERVYRAMAAYEQKHVRITTTDGETYNGYIDVFISRADNDEAPPHDGQGYVLLFPENGEGRVLFEEEIESIVPDKDGRKTPKSENGT